MNRTLSLLVPLSLLIAGSAQGAQLQSATDWERDLPLSLSSAAIDLHIGLAGATERGTAAWGDRMQFDLDLDGVSEDEEFLLAAALADQCETAGLPPALCAPLADGIASSLADFNGALLDLVPEYVAFEVGSYGWVSAWTGLYPMTGVHEYGDGSEQSWAYMLNNNTGADEGAFVATGLSLSGGAVSDGLACADVSGALIAGSFPSVNGPGVTADFLADRELACVGGAEGVVVAGTVGLTFGGTVVGVVE